MKNYASKVRTVDAESGETLVSFIAKPNKDRTACELSCACTTCHVDC